MFVDASMKPPRLHRGMLDALMDETDLVISSAKLLFCIIIWWSITRVACSRLRRCLRSHLTFVKTSFSAGHLSELIHYVFLITTNYLSLFHHVVLGCSIMTLSGERTRPTCRDSTLLKTSSTQKLGEQYSPGGTYPLTRPLHATKY